MSYYSHGSAKGGFSLKGLVGGIAKGAVSLATGNPFAAVANVAAGAFSSSKQGSVVKGGVVVPSKQSLLGGTVGSLIQHLPGPAGVIAGGIASYVQNRGGAVAMVDGQCPKGYHPNKQAGPKGAAGSYCVRNRSMNPANGRAIGRAATRIRRGAKQYAKVLRILGKKTGKTVPRGRKRA